MNALVELIHGVSWFHCMEFLNAHKFLSELPLEVPPKSIQFILELLPWTKNFNFEAWKIKREVSIICFMIQSMVLVIVLKVMHWYAHLINIQWLQAIFKEYPSHYMACNVKNKSLWLSTRRKKGLKIFQYIKKDYWKVLFHSIQILSYGISSMCWHCNLN